MEQMNARYFEAVTQAQLGMIFAVGASSGRHALFVGALDDLFDDVKLVRTVNRDRVGICLGLNPDW
ncbi:DNA helicase [Salmonella phage 19]|nr:DNA helicase [Salmonella phage 19]